jgi:hypothetical protein
MEALDKLEADVIALQRTTAIPKVHRYQLTRAESSAARTTR